VNSNIGIELLVFNLVEIDVNTNSNSQRGFFNILVDILDDLNDLRHYNNFLNNLFEEIRNLNNFFLRSNNWNNFLLHSGNLFNFSLNHISHIFSLDVFLSLNNLVFINNNFFDLSISSFESNNFFLNCGDLFNSLVNDWNFNCSVSNLLNDVVDFNNNWHLNWKLNNARNFNNFFGDFFDFVNFRNLVVDNNNLFNDSRYFNNLFFVLNDCFSDSCLDLLQNFLIVRGDFFYFL